MKVEMKRMKVWVCGVMLVGLLAGPALAQGQDTSRSRRRVRVVTPLAQVAHDRAHCDCRACWPNRRGWDVLTPRKRYGVRIPLRRVYRDTSAWPLRREVLGGGSAGGDMGVVRPLRADGSREMGVIRPLAPEQRIEPLPVDDAPVETFSEAPTATANDVPEKVSQDVFQKSQAALEPLVPGIDAGSLGTLSTQSYGVRPPTQGLSEDPWVLLNQGNYRLAAARFASAGDSLEVQTGAALAAALSGDAAGAEAMMPATPALPQGVTLSDEIRQRIEQTQEVFYSETPAMQEALAVLLAL